MEALNLDVFACDIRDDIIALNRIGYAGPLSIEWEDSGMEREWSAQNALAFVLRSDFTPSMVAFDAAFSVGKMPGYGRPANPDN